MPARSFGQLTSGRNPLFAGRMNDDNGIDRGEQIGETTRVEILIRVDWITHVHPVTEEISCNVHGGEYSPFPIGHAWLVYIVVYFIANT